MNAQHTPGPWSVVDQDKIVGPKGNTVAECLGYSVHAKDEWQKAQGGREANARLIASAPELLDALERLVEDYERVKRFAHDNGLQWVGSSQAPDWQARQVISKARGQA